MTATAPGDRASAVATDEEVAAAVAQQLVMRVDRVERQDRWRPTWFVRGERAGAPFELVVRGDRIDAVGFPLRHEHAFHQILEQHGIPVAGLYGWCDALGAVLMEMVPGRPDFEGVADEDRDVIVDDYLRAMVAVHQLPVAPFVQAGITQAADGSAIESMRIQEAQWRAAKDWPDPFMEFCLGWLHRHEPSPGRPQTPILCDTGQFHHDGGRLRAILDLEGGHIGDPMMDLAVWRMRDTIIPFGDMRALYARYEELSGAPVDLEAIKCHYFASTIGNELMFGAAVRHPAPDTDLMTYLQWDSDTNLMATECLADLLGIEVDDVEVPEPRRSRHAATFEHLVRSLGGMRPAEPAVAHEVRLAFRAARHLARVDEIGDAMLEADLDEVEPVLGWRPATWFDADVALEQLVRQDAQEGHRRDAELVRLFHRRNQRFHHQLGPAGSRMVRHVRTQPFG